MNIYIYTCKHVYQVIRFNSGDFKLLDLKIVCWILKSSSNFRYRNICRILKSPETASILGVSATKCSKFRGLIRIDYSNSSGHSTLSKRAATGVCMYTRILFIRHFPQKSPMISGSFAEMTCNLRHPLHSTSLHHPVRRFACATVNWCTQKSFVACNNHLLRATVICCAQ